jgi:hypothetical protein
LLPSLLKALARAGAYVAKSDETVRLRNFLFKDSTFSSQTLGKSASNIAERAGLDIPPSTKNILAPISGSILKSHSEKTVPGCELCARSPCKCRQLCGTHGDPHFGRRADGIDL